MDRNGAPPLPAARPRNKGLPLPLEMKDTVLTSQQVNLMWAQVDLALKILDVLMEETRNDPTARTQKALLDFAGPQMIHEH